MDLVSDEKFMTKYGRSTTMKAMTDYITARTYIANELKLRKEDFGSGSIDSVENVDLKDQFDEFILKLKLYDKAFSDFYTRYLENDTFGVIKR
jgi:hypothetical protein